MGIKLGYHILPNTDIRKSQEITGNHTDIVNVHFWYIIGDQMLVS